MDQTLKGTQFLIGLFDLLLISLSAWIRLFSVCF